VGGFVLPVRFDLLG